MPVYFIQQGEDGPVKIGYGEDPKIRLGQLQIGNPEPLRIIRVLDAGQEAEAFLHRKFKRQRLRGEWFSYHPDMARIGDPYEPEDKKPKFDGALGRYLHENNLTLETFADRIGVSHASVSRYVAGKRLPDPAIMGRIREATDGAVQPNDFYGARPAA